MKEIAFWSYEDLQREVSKSLKRPGNVLFDLVRAADPGVEEGVFVDNVTRHIRRGEFLLLIVGDGIREGVESIVDFVQKHSGLHFNLALVEAALYRDTDEHVIVQPRAHRAVSVSGTRPRGQGVHNSALGESVDKTSRDESGSMKMNSGFHLKSAAKLSNDWGPPLFHKRLRQPHLLLRRFYRALRP